MLYAPNVYVEVFQPNSLELQSSFLTKRALFIIKTTQPNFIFSNVSIVEMAIAVPVYITCI